MPKKANTPEVQRWHISEDQQIRRCVAQARKCHLTHFDSYPEAVQAIAKKQEDELSNTIAKALNIKLDPIQTPLPELSLARVTPDFYYETYDGDWDVEVEWYPANGDYYYDEGDSDSGDIDYHANDQHISSIGIKRVGDWEANVAKLFNTTKENIQNYPELLALAKQLGADTPKAYYGYGEPDYYDDQPHIRFEDTVAKELANWYWKTSYNGFDHDGILEYVRGKGTETIGLSPIEAIKEQLRNENGNKINSLVEAARYVKIVNLRIDQITVTNETHLTRVQPQPLEVPTENGKKISGVVVADRNRFLLVDGYHRYKDAKKKGRTLGDYVVLSKDAYDNWRADNNTAPLY